ncbi:MAG: hypothetical protein ACFE89_10540 [Candidatus Hodarchaeota archaeon]
MPKRNNPTLEESRTTNLRWKITLEKNLKASPRPGTIPYQLIFAILNGFDFPIRVKVIITSHSNRFLFRKRIYKMIGRNRITKMDNVLTQNLKHEIPSGQTKQYKFSALFLPSRAIPSPYSLNLEYQIVAQNGKKRISSQTDSLKLQIPLD